MKNSIRILLCALLFLVTGIVGAAVAPEPSHILSYIQQQNTTEVILMAAPIIVSASISQQLIDDLKLKYQKIKIITVVVEEAESDAEGKEIKPAEQYQFIVRRPDRTLIKLLLPLAEQRKIDEFSEKAVKNLVVAGDMDALDDGLVFMGVVSQLKQMISPAQSFLSNA